MPRRIIAVLVLVGAAGGPAFGADPDASEGVSYGPPRQLCALENRRIHESSGIACSRRTPGIFWTHNDSGDDRIFAFDAKGRNLASLKIIADRVIDTEDIASFTMDGKHYLAIADTGDNAKRRTACAIYLAEEPALPADGKPLTATITPLRTIRFKFQGGAQDAEGLAFDVPSRTFFLATRNHRPECQIYQLPLPADGDDKVQEAKPIAEHPILCANALDISPDGLRAVLGSLIAAYEFTRRPDETWAAAFARKPRTIATPLRRQGEAICYGPDGKTLYLTSEGVPCPLWEIPVAEREPEK